MKTLFKIIVLLLLTSCMTPIELKAPGRIVTDKEHDIFTGYFLKLEPDVYQVSRKEYKTYNIGDTIK